MYYESSKIVHLGLILGSMALFFESIDPILTQLHLNIRHSVLRYSQSRSIIGHYLIYLLIMRPRPPLARKAQQEFDDSGDSDDDAQNTFQNSRKNSRQVTQVPAPTKGSRRSQQRVSGMYYNHDRYAAVSYGHHRRSSSPYERGTSRTSMKCSKCASTLNVPGDGPIIPQPLLSLVQDGRSCHDDWHQLIRRHGAKKGNTRNEFRTAFTSLLAPPGTECQCAARKQLRPGL